MRRLLVIGAMAVLRASMRSAPPEGSWLARKPRMLVAVALGPQDGARRLDDDDPAGGPPGSGSGDRVIATIMAIRPGASWRLTPALDGAGS